MLQLYSEIIKLIKRLATFRPILRLALQMLLPRKNLERLWSFQNVLLQNEECLPWTRRYLSSSFSSCKWVTRVDTSKLSVKTKYWIYPIEIKGQENTSHEFIKLEGQFCQLMIQTLMILSFRDICRVLST